jgi:acyl carrier protein
MSLSSLKPMTEKTSLLSSETLTALICETLAKRLKKPSEEITLDTRFDALEIDSLDLAEMFFLLEDELKITIPLDQGVQLETVSDVLRLVELTLHQTQ